MIAAIPAIAIDGVLISSERLYWSNPYFVDTPAIGRVQKVGWTGRISHSDGDGSEFSVILIVTNRVCRPADSGLCHDNSVGHLEAAICDYIGTQQLLPARVSDLEIILAVR